MVCIFLNLIYSYIFIKNHIYFLKIRLYLNIFRFFLISLNALVRFFAVKNAVSRKRNKNKFILNAIFAKESMLKFLFQIFHTDVKILHIRLKNILRKNLKKVFENVKNKT